MVIKLGVSTTKIKYLTEIYDRSKCLSFVFGGDLLVNVGPQVIYGIIKRKIWTNVIAGLKCKVQNNKKIQDTQTSITSTMKAEQER